MYKQFAVGPSNVVCRRVNL